MKKILLMIIGVFAISSCVASHESSVVTPDPGQEIYYHSQAEADVALDAFDKANPTCQLWTNWQKMCSRTGENGKTFCKKAYSTVKPSTPFCAAKGYDSNIGPTGDYTGAQLGSYLRFCEEKTGELLGGIPLCRFSQSRPFSALIIADLKHPWCRQWRRTVPESLNPELSARIGFSCAERSMPAWCESVDGMGSGPVNSNKQSQEEYVGIAILDPNFNVVNGPYCRRRKSNASK